MHVHLVSTIKYVCIAVGIAICGAFFSFLLSKVNT